jgi:hypothetical protein
VGLCCWCLVVRLLKCVAVLLSIHAAGCVVDLV